MVQKLCNLYESIGTFTQHTYVILFSAYSISISRSGQKYTTLWPGWSLIFTLILENTYSWRGLTPLQGAGSGLWTHCIIPGVVPVWNKRRSKNIKFSVITASSSGMLVGYTSFQCKQCIQKHIKKLFQNAV